MFFYGQGQLKSLLSNKNEKVSFEKLSTSESKWNYERDETADKTKKRNKQKLKIKNHPEPTGKEVKDQN